MTVQEKLCREFIVTQGYELVEVFIEKGESAKTVERTELNRLWDFCSKKANNIQFIIAYKVDRIARNRNDYRELGIKRLKYGIRFRYVTELFDDTPAGRFMEDMFASMAHLDNDIRTERAVNGSKEAMRQGRYVWKAPIGYTNAIVGGKSTIVQTDKAPLILKAFHEVERGVCSTEEIRLKLAKEGLVGNNGKPLTGSYFYTLLRNKIYAGWIVKFGEIHQGKFEPIVPQSLFDIAQMRLDGRKNIIKHYKKENPDFPLRQFIINENRLKLKGYWAQGKKKKYPYYSFGTKNTTIRKEEMEKKFKAFLDKLSLDEQYLQIMKANIINSLKSNIGNVEEEKIKIDKKITEIYQQMRHFSTNQYKGLITEELLKIHLDELTKELRKLEIEKVQLVEGNKYDIDGLLDFAEEVLKNPAKLWEIKESPIKRRLQVFVFPNGLLYENSKLRTLKVRNIFNLKSIIREQISSSVHNSFPKENTFNKRNFKNEQYLFGNKAHWQEVFSEIVELELIVSNKISPLM